MNGQFVAFTANITTDPEVRTTPAGKNVCTLRMAANSRIQVNGEWTDGAPVFYDATLWEAEADNAGQSYHRGDRVVVFGINHVEYFEHNGERRSKNILRDFEIGASTRWAQVAIAKA